MTMQLPTLLRPNLGGMAALSPGQAFTVLAVGSERELTRQVAQLLDDAGLDGCPPDPGGLGRGRARPPRHRAPGHRVPGRRFARSGQPQRTRAAAGGSPGRAGGALADAHGRGAASSWLVADAGTPSCRPVGGGEPSAAAGTARRGCPAAVLSRHPRSPDRARQPLAARGAPGPCGRPQPARQRPWRPPVHRPGRLQVDQRPPRPRGR